MLFDLSNVKFYDLIYKGAISDENKIVLFSLNTTLFMITQFTLLRYIQRLSTGRALTLLKSVLYKISIGSFIVLSILLAMSIFQMYYNLYYSELISIIIVSISYGVSAIFILRLSLLFLFWYRSNHSRLVFLYFISMMMIGFNLITTAVITDIKINDRSDEARPYVGGTVDISVGAKYTILNDIYLVSSIVSFISIWVTTAMLMNSYREKLASAMIYWLILSIPLIYFFTNYFYLYIVANLIPTYFAVDPITVAMLLTVILTLSKPIGGLTFAIAFWKISRNVAFEKNMKTYMLLSGWGILLIFSADQGFSQTIAPFPPFGLVTITSLILAAYLIFLGIYNSAALVSVNEKLRTTIRKSTIESKLLGSIGQAEMEKEIENTVKRITKRTAVFDNSIPVELDEPSLRKYIDFVVKEVNEKKNL